MTRRGRIPRDKRRYLLKDSDRSGFTYFRHELVRDGAFLVHPDERDMPPSSNESLGGEGDGIAVDLRTGRLTTTHAPSVPDFQDPDENQNDTPSSSDVDITTGLVSHYKMNDNAATSAIVATVGDDAVYRDSSGEINTSTGSSTGKVNEALDFDGTDEYANATLPTVFEDIASNDFSICLWINAGTLASQATWERIFEANYDTDNTAQFFVWDNNSVGFGIADAGDARQYGGTGLDAETWYHLIGTWDASENEVKFYVNNALKSSTIAQVWGIGDTQELRLGSRTDGAGFYDGLIDDVRIYDTVLTAAQRAAIYNNGSGTES